MEENSLVLGISKMLKLAEPWSINEIKINDNLKISEVFIEYSKGSRFLCSECEKMCKVHDSTEKRIRHLDLFEYRCYLVFKLPRTKCNVHGIKTITTLPMTRSGSHYSFFLSEK